MTCYLKPCRACSSSEQSSSPPHPSSTCSTESSDSIVNAGSGATLLSRQVEHHVIDSGYIYCDECECRVSAPDDLNENGICTPCVDRRAQEFVIFDLFAGTGSSTRAFADAGDCVYTFELDPYFNVTETISVLDLTPEYLLAKYGRPDFVWASPPCTAFSVASMGHHWISGGETPMPRTDAALRNQELVAHTRALIEALKPRYGYLIENPRAMLRKLPPVQGLPRQTITYCQYGDSRMKPTDLWGVVPHWSPRPACKNGSPCHEAAPRGARTGTQGLKGARDRSMIPYTLGADIREAMLQSSSDMSLDLWGVGDE